MEALTSSAGLIQWWTPLETMTIREDVDDFLPAATSCGIRSKDSSEVAR
jgi:hypothetical protein